MQQREVGVASVQLFQIRLHLLQRIANPRNLCCDEERLPRPASPSSSTKAGVSTQKKPRGARLERKLMENRTRSIIHRCSPRIFRLDHAAMRVHQLASRSNSCRNFRLVEVIPRTVQACASSFNPWRDLAHAVKREEGRRMYKQPNRSTRSSGRSAVVLWRYLEEASFVSGVLSLCMRAWQAPYQYCTRSQSIRHTST